MQCEFSTFLATARLGQLSLGASRDTTASLVGLPDYWDADTFPASQSDIWIYDGLQIYFGGTNKVEALRLFPKNPGSSETAKFLPLRFTDNVQPIFGDLVGFKEYLRSLQIAVVENQTTNLSLWPSSSVFVRFGQDYETIYEDGEFRGFGQPLNTFHVIDVTAALPDKLSKYGGRVRTDDISA